MTRLKLDGASYAFALPDGSWGALMPASINTSQGAIPLPGEPVLFLVGTRFNGKLLMAGQGHDSGACWFWDGTRWAVAGTTFGVSPCAFGPGFLYVAVAGNRYLALNLNTGETTTHEDQVGSQGLRYVSGSTLATGDETYRDGELFEWTQRGDVRVGQGHEGGAIINGHILDPGDRRFIRFERAGDNLAVAMVDLPGQSAILHWLTVADIASLPPLVPVQQPPAPVPVPVPQPTPEPAPMPTVPQSQIDRAVAMLAQVRHETGFGPGQEPLPYVRVTAQRLGAPWGLNGKRGDANNPSGDILAYDFPGQQPQLFDVLGDGGGANTAQFGALEYPQSAGAVWLSAGSAQPVPTQGTPAPIPGEVSTLDLFRTFQAYVEHTESRLTALEARPVGGGSGSIDGVRVALKTDNGHYVTAEGGGGSDLLADRTEVKGWETFTLVKQ